MMSEKIRMTAMRISPLLDTRVAREMETYWASLAKPAGGLGRLEEMVVHLGLVRGTPLPSIQRKGLLLFCGDHGVAATGVTANPEDYTRRMTRALLRGGAAVNALCRLYRIELMAVDAGMRGAREPGAMDCRIGEGTANMLQGPAMSEEQVNRALETGMALAADAAARFDVVGMGDVGAGNTTSAAAIFSALAGLDASVTVGPGTVDGQLGLTRKTAAVRGAINRNRDEALNPFGALRCLGGFEIAAMTGFLLGASAARLPVVVDGFTAGVSALVARGLAPDCLDAALFSHLAPEPAHAALLEYLRVTPYLDLDLRTGEGVGAALALGLLEAALSVYREMGTLEETGISPGSGAALQ